MLNRENTEFELSGINHLALVCKDMKRTVEFYTEVLGMPLIKTLEIPGGGQHFFFDCGGGDAVAFFWFPKAHEAAPGIASAGTLPFTPGDPTSAHGSMNHLAFNVSPEKIEEYREKLAAKGVDVTFVANHDDSPMTVSAEINETTFVRSIYFQDPDGIVLEFAATTREFTEDDIKVPPKTAADAL